MTGWLVEVKVSAEQFLGTRLRCASTRQAEATEKKNVLTREKI
jgi:hypothetical protein